MANCIMMVEVPPGFVPKPRWQVGGGVAFHVERPSQIVELADITVSSSSIAAFQVLFMPDIPFIALPHLSRSYSWCVRLDRHRSNSSHLWNRIVRNLSISISSRKKTIPDMYSWNPFHRRPRCDQYLGRIETEAYEVYILHDHSHISRLSNNYSHSRYTLRQ